MLGSARRDLFQSAPGLLAGRYCISRAWSWRQMAFQSAPGLLAGRYVNGNLHRQPVERFQSAPGLLAGRYRPGVTAISLGISFNPLPAY